MPSWEEIEAVFDAVLDAPAHERPMVLDHLTAGKPELRAEVTSLLAAHEASGGEDDPFTGSAGTFAAPFVAAELAAEEASLRPTQIGRYRIVDEIGRGGMGAVYLAERADGQFEQQVALKLIKLGTDSELVRQRFLNERQILARLQHPNIARLLDGGTEESTGRPYFVMEYVHGQPIAAYARQNQLSIDRRLSLFLDVCEAVQFAHRNLIVHRDLKPSNILVTEQGQARLLDFGIAKMLAEDDGPALTRTGGQLMTPEYAAPEQISGGDTTTATDVYALGLLLYELLTGQRAQQFDSQAPSVIERVICDTEPPRPSTTSRLPHISARRLAGDLDTIVLKALQKSPERRYASAEALAADIRRHLDGLPILARPDSFSYRAGKFARRHRIGLATVAGVLALIAVFVVQLVRERDRARVEANKATAVSDFLIDLFRSSNPHVAQGDTLTVYDILERGSSRIEGELAEQPLVRAKLLGTLGTIHRELGQLERADSLAQSALSILQDAGAENTVEYAEALHVYGLAELFIGNYGQADSTLTEAARLLEARAGPDAEITIRSQIDLGTVWMELGRLEDAERILRGALSARLQRHGPDGELTAVAQNTLGDVMQEMDRVEEAEALYKAALATHLKRHGEVHSLTSLNLYNLGYLYSTTSRLNEALDLYERVLAIDRQVFGSLHPEIAITLNNIGLLLSTMGRHLEAVEYFEQALAILNGAYGASHPHTTITLLNLGTTYHRSGQYALSEPILRRVVTYEEQEYGMDHHYVSNSLLHLGTLLLDAGRAAEARPILERGLGIAEAALPTPHRFTARLQLQLARLALQDDRLEKSQVLLDAAGPQLDAVLSPPHEALAEYALVRAQLHHAQGDAAAAAPFEAAVAADTLAQKGRLAIYFGG